jgi:acetyltransferase-like isoleucine patch superfamily enzyme
MAAEFLHKCYRFSERKVFGWINRLRVLRLRALGAHVGKNVRAFGRFTIIGDPRNLTLGDGCTLNEGLHLNARGKIWIGADVHLSAGVQIHTGELDTSDERRAHRAGAVTIEDGAWIASGAILVPGVTVGQGSVIGALALVADDIAAGVLAVGVPAKVKKHLGSRS